MNVPFLSPRIIGTHSDEYAEVCSWPFSDSYVRRLLTSDIPQRVKFGNGIIRVYCDANSEIVGFGSLDICTEYANLSGGRFHVYIPLVAVNPAMERRGYGTEIVRHLISEAALLVAAARQRLADTLFLDVYTTNTPAIRLYEKLGFERLTDAISDPVEKADYFVMGRSVKIT